MSRLPPREPSPRVTTLNVSVRKLAEIKLNSDYLRLDTDVSALAHSIDSIGLIHPVTINSENELLAGARRFQAAKELEWEEIPVHVVDRDEMIQELISIDENLVRTPLKPLELERFLNRGRELYEKLYPDTTKVDLSADELTAEEKRQKKEEEEADQDSFVAVTAEKTGLSKAVIKGAIKRDELAADEVKHAREEGELNATKANELIRLDPDLQAQVLPLVSGKTVKETRRIVNAAKEGGINAAREECNMVVPMPREYSQMIAPIKRVNKSIARILAEELHYNGPEQKAINNQLVQLKNQLLLYFEMMGVEG